MIRFQLSEDMIGVHYLGHSSFVLQFGDAVTVLVDYGAFNAWVEWGWDSPIYDVGDLVLDIITYSHTHHEDHYDKSRQPLNVPYILTGLDALEFKGVQIRPIRTSESSLAEVDNSSYLFIYKGAKVLHLGDCQANIMHIEDAAHKEQIKTLFPDTYDLLLMPIESQSKFIPQAEAFIRCLRPRRLIPMHYWSAAYKQDFLSYLAVQSGNDEGLRYQIDAIDCPAYTFSVCDTDTGVEPVKIISLEPSLF